MFRRPRGYSPPRRRSPSPYRRASPPRGRSPSPIRRRSPSPIRRRSPSPPRRYDKPPAVLLLRAAIGILQFILPTRPLLAVSKHFRVQAATRKLYSAMEPGLLPLRAGAPLFFPQVAPTPRRQPPAPAPNQPQPCARAQRIPRAPPRLPGLCTGAVGRSGPLPQPVARARLGGVQRCGQALGLRLTGWSYRCGLCMQGR